MCPGVPDASLPDALPISDGGIFDGGTFCANDCQCSGIFVCNGGICGPPSLPGQSNICCTNPNCQPGTMCIEPNGTTFICDAIPTPVGAPCNAGTMSCGSFGQCIDPMFGFPGGYCTQDCSMGGQPCPGGSTCRDTGGGGPGFPSQICLETCNTGRDCRMGYNCVQLGITPPRVCWPSSPVSMNPMGAQIGSPCMVDNDCKAGTTCLQEQNMGPMSSWQGGYCTVINCDPQTNPCPAGSNSECLQFPGLYSLCLETCPQGGNQSTCRSGYYCLGPAGQSGVCITR
jgi:hypothetical protein